MESEESYFIINVPVFTSEHAESVLNVRFDVANKIYNCSLRECEKRRKKYQKSQSYQQMLSFRTLIKKLEKQYEKQKNKKLKQQITEIKNKAKDLEQKARKESGYYLWHSKNKGFDNSLFMYSSDIIQDTWLSDHIDSHCRNKLMERAFKASEKCMYSKKVKQKDGSFKKPKVHYKSERNLINSVEGKEIKSPLTVKKIDNKLNVVWNNLHLPLIHNENNPKAKSNNNYYKALKAFDEVKYYRLKRKLIKNKYLYSVQFICQGKPELNPNHILGIGDIGVDLGPSTIATTSDINIDLKPIFDIDLKPIFDIDVKKLEKEQKRLQRSASRKQVINNPTEYNEDKSVKTKNEDGSKRKVKIKKSKKQRKIEQQLANKQRKLAEKRKAHHFKLAHDLRSQGNKVKLDNDKVKSWQKMYGKSINKNAPGMLMDTLKYVFELTDGVYEEINTKESCSSQTCPCCLNKQKKELSDRIHKCEYCGFIMQRDITSSLYNKFYESEGNTLDTKKVLVFLTEKRPLLLACIERVKQFVRVRGNSSTFGTIPELEQIASTGIRSLDDAGFCSLNMENQKVEKTIPILIASNSS